VNPGPAHRPPTPSPEESSDLPVTRGPCRDVHAPSQLSFGIDASPSTRSRSTNIVDGNYLPVVVGVTVIGDRVLRLLPFSVSSTVVDVVIANP
jgi:hypothetical protein